MNTVNSCSCSELGDAAVVGMGAHDGLDGRLLETLERTHDHGGAQWWLCASLCSVCGQQWLIAQEERIHDNFCFKRMTAAESRALTDQGVWPDDFLRFEDVLRIERRSGKIARFFTAMSPALIDTTRDLRRERPTITVEEIAYLLMLTEAEATRLVKAT